MPQEIPEGFFLSKDGTIKRISLNQKEASESDDEETRKRYHIWMINALS